MNLEQATRLAVTFAGETARSATSNLAAVCAALLDVTGAALTIPPRAGAGPSSVSSRAVAVLEQNQLATGEGPCHTAFTSRAAIRTPRLDREAASRWPVFVALARNQGMNAVFVFPLAHDGDVIGLLTLYQRREGHLTPAQDADADAVVEVLSQVLDDPVESLEGATAVVHGAEVHQATGMVAAQLSISVSDALQRIGAYALAHGRSTADIAKALVARQIRFDDR